MIACGRPISLQRYAQAHDRGDGRRKSQENRKRLRIKISRATWFPMPSGYRDKPMGGYPQKGPEVSA